MPEVIVDKVKMDMIRRKAKQVLENPDKILNYALSAGIVLYTTGYFIRAIKK